MPINTIIPLPIHFLEIARGECNCSPEIQREVWEWGVKAMNDAWQAEIRSNPLFSNLLF